MNMQESLNVAEILKRPIFQHASVVAGSEGVHRPVRWVHVLEIMDGLSYVHGHEMILMTGVGLGQDNELNVQFVKELVESQVSALCIELVHQYVQIPDRVIQFADQHRFPIIVFEKAVSFIKITQDIHSILINRHHHQLLSLERVSNQFLQLTLRPQGVMRILELLHRETHCPVWLEDHLGENISCPEAQPMPEEKALIRQPIVAWDVQVGDLYVQYSGEPPEFLRLVLDRAATAIAQELLHRISMEERQLSTGRKWMEDLITHGKGDIPPAMESGIRAGCRLVFCAVGFRRISFKHSDRMNQEESIAVLQWAKSLSRVFEPLGIRAWMATRGGNRTMILLDLEPSSTLMDRVQNGFHQLFRNLQKHSPADRFWWSVGVSHPFDHLEQSPRFWQQASLALSISQRSGKEKNQMNDGNHVICYDDLHSWQLFLQISPSILHQFVETQLGVLLDYDQRNGTELIKTLEAFLEAGQSKQKAAKDLFIHRQTLYYRLDQMTSLLGEGWEKPPRRLTLDMALAAHRFLSARGEG